MKGKIQDYSLIAAFLARATGLKFPVPLDGLIPTTFRRPNRSSEIPTQFQTWFPASLSRGYGSDVFRSRENWSLDRGGVSKSTRHRSRRVAVIELFIFPVVIFLLGGQARSSPASHAQARMVRAVDKTFREGIHAQLPPHLSTLLGISAEKECLVMQGVVRTGSVVQGFDVSMVNKDDVVLFAVNETTNDQTLYLTAPDGRLRRVVAVQAGMGQVRRITEQDRKAFEKEKQFWLDRLAPIRAPQ